ncbi:hypothetical protein CMUS01_04615 [Colletotrichum musicola]|uniref:Uncharacterized protein n=1 Tax=Colletotrichum musicola TaxID=2175873 RepID=A0A8H6NLX0_9PEZI|nr:hypothetical protein CMUS01_04615 [Colletotrichum musicola]
MKVDANLGFGPPSTLANRESLGRRRRRAPSRSQSAIPSRCGLTKDAVKMGLAVSGFEWLRWLLRRLRAKSPYRQDQSDRSSSARRPASELPESRVDGVWTLKSGRTAKGGAAGRPERREKVRTSRNRSSCPRVVPAKNAPGPNECERSEAGGDERCRWERLQREMGAAGACCSTVQRGLGAFPTVTNTADARVLGSLGDRCPAPLRGPCSWPRDPLDVSNPKQQRKQHTVRPLGCEMRKSLGLGPRLARLVHLLDASSPRAPYLQSPASGHSDAASNRSMMPGSPTRQILDPIVMITPLSVDRWIDPHHLGGQAAPARSGSWQLDTVFPVATVQPPTTTAASHATPAYSRTRGRQGPAEVFAGRQPQPVSCPVARCPEPAPPPPPPPPLTEEECPGRAQSTCGNNRDSQDSGTGAWLAPRNEMPPFRWNPSILRGSLFYNGSSGPQAFRQQAGAGRALSRPRDRPESPRKQARHAQPPARKTSE